MSTRQVWRLARRPVGSIVTDDFLFGSEPIPELRDGQFLLRVRYLSLDPAQRVFIDDREQFLPPVALGAPMRGLVVGVVEKSKKEGIAEGTILSGAGEWADYIISDGTGLTELAAFPGLSLAETFGTFSLVGPAAYFGLLDVTHPQPGETLVVSAAAGGVGQIVGQLGKLKGCQVIGIAGGPKKCAFVTEQLGFDACIDYKSVDVGEALDHLAPEGVDIYFEQVGGPIRNAVMERMKIFGRVSVCGIISEYNTADVDTQSSFWWTIMMRRLTVRGFIFDDYQARFPEAVENLAAWMQSGHLRTRQDIRQGLENAVSSLQDLYSGRNFGKLLLEVTS
ncbi:NADP-dependent oxidoreductase [Paenalcaligenes niemegkensis]|uniref:NADP-dependent oxidoreductase n=1 Tax=Paenalcaligenes niemegkensis TaxID=2895469 RepID=UPI001EE83888|nr:NADP-dependent oxidoreductase [Paenalcaligenes niemegkensis]MCQ9617862.1 NADP-dependent oxidoreductase [Paenalcaligenes niemegkensis]